MAGLLGQRHRHGGQHIVGGQDHFVAEVFKAPVEKAGGLGEAADVGPVGGGIHHPLGTQHHADEGKAPLGGGGHQAVACVGGGSGLDAVGIGVAVADGPPVAQQVVGGVESPFLRQIGGGDGDLGVQRNGAFQRQKERDDLCGTCRIHAHAGIL